MTFIIKRVPVWPVAKVTFVITFILSLIGILLYSLFLTSILSGLSALVNEELSGIPALTGGAVFMFGLFGAVFSSIIQTIIVILFVLLYNGLSSLVGGVEMEVEKVEDYLSYASRQVPNEPIAPKEPPLPTMEPQDEDKNDSPANQG